MEDKNLTNFTLLMKGYLMISILRKESQCFALIKRQIAGAKRYETIRGCRNVHVLLRDP